MAEPLVKSNNPEQQYFPPEDKSLYGAITNSSSAKIVMGILLLLLALTVFGTLSVGALFGFGFLTLSTGIIADTFIKKAKSSYAKSKRSERERENLELVEKKAEGRGRVVSQTPSTQTVAQTPSTQTPPPSPATPTVVPATPPPSSSPALPSALAAVKREAERVVKREAAAKRKAERVVKREAEEEARRAAAARRKEKREVKREKTAADELVVISVPPPPSTPSPLSSIERGA